jgi:hypothetical protein
MTTMKKTTNLLKIKKEYCLNVIDSLLKWEFNQFYKMITDLKIDYQWPQWRKQPIYWKIKKEYCLNEIDSLLKWEFNQFYKMITGLKIDYQWPQWRKWPIYWTD